MLIPLTRKSFEMLIPPVATGAQYAYYWGNAQNFLKRLLISVIAVVVIWLMTPIFGQGGANVQLIIGIFGALYWLWGPIALASYRNWQCRKYQYCGFWQGKVSDVYITEDLIGQEETVNNQGDLVIVENRERRINLEVADKTGFNSLLRVPLKKEHKKIKPGQVALMLVMSNQPNLSRIEKVSDIYIPSQDVWVSDYPYLRRDEFIDISQELKQSRKQPKERTKRKNSEY